MHRSRQSSPLYRASPPTRLDETKLRVKPYILRDPQPPVEVHQVDAAAQKYMLAVVDDLRSGFIGGRPAPQEWPPFKDPNMMSRTPQRRCGGEPGQSSADHDYVGHGSDCGGTISSPAPARDGRRPSLRR